MEARARTGRLGVVLLQLGGPASLADVQPFLEGMLGDPDLFQAPIPKRIRSTLARLAAKWRAGKVRQLYAAIGGKSPIGAITRRQAELLEGHLSATTPCRVFVAMRYGNPSSEDAINEIREVGCDRLILLPLYPHYCGATTGSSFREWQKRCEQAGLRLLTQRIESYADSPAYISAVADRVREALARFPPGCEPHLVFSAHGLPRSYIKRGDPYQQQIEASVRLVLRELDLNHSHVLCYQSKVGPQRWLEPSLPDTLRRLGKNGTDAVLVIPISFVSDHLETLSEIDIEAREAALGWGIRHFQTTEGLNDSPTFISALAELVRAALNRPPKP